MANQKDISVAFKIEGADASKVDIEKIKTALDESGKAGTQAAQTITDAFNGIERNSDRVTNKISDGRMVTVRDAVAINQQFLLLETTLKETFGSIEQAPQAIQDAFSRAQGAVNNTTSTVRDMSTSAKFLRQDINEAGGAWLGFENAIARAAGEQGKYVAAFALVIKAWEEGWGIGMKLNKFFGTDMTLWEEKSHALGIRIGDVVKALGDTFVANMARVWDALHGQLPTVQSAWQDFKNEMMVIAVAIENVFMKTADQMARETRETADNAKKSAEDAAQTKLLTEEKSKLAVEVAHAVLALRDENAELDKQKIAAQDADLGIHRTTDEVGYLKRGLDSATLSLEAQKTKVTELTREFGAADPMTKQAVAEQQRLEQQVTASKDSYDRASKELDQYKQRLDEAKAAVESGTEKVRQDTEAQQKRTEQTALLKQGITLEKQEEIENQKAIEESTTAHKEGSTAAASHGNAIEGVIGKLHYFEDANGKVRVEMVKTTDATEKQSTAVGEQGAKLDETKPKVDAWVTGQKAATDAINATTPAITTLTLFVDGLTAAFGKATTAADLLSTRLHVLKDAAAQAAGDGGGPIGPQLPPSGGVDSGSNMNPGG